MNVRSSFNHTSLNGLLRMENSEVRSFTVLLKDNTPGRVVDREDSTGSKTKVASRFLVVVQNALAHRAEILHIDELVKGFNRGMTAFRRCAVADPALRTNFLDYIRR